MSLQTVIYVLFLATCVAHGICIAPMVGGHPVRNTVLMFIPTVAFLLGQLA